jgi:hypothetical protein
MLMLFIEEVVKLFQQQEEFIMQLNLLHNQDYKNQFSFAKLHVLLMLWEEYIQFLIKEEEL